MWSIPFMTETDTWHEKLSCTCSWLLSCCVAWCNCCWFFFLTSCSATLISSNVTPWVDLLVSLTRFAWAFLCVSDSSSRTGGTNDLDQNITVSECLMCKFLPSFVTLSMLLQWWVNKLDLAFRVHLVSFPSVHAVFSDNHKKKAKFLLIARMSSEQVSSFQVRSTYMLYYKNWTMQYSRECAKKELCLKTWRSQKIKINHWNIDKVNVN